MPKTIARPKRQKRDADATRERILQAGIAEFCANGYGGARIEQVAKRAPCNIRMIYHYFGDKEHLYIAALERVYGEIRRKEKELNLSGLSPLDGMKTLVTFTYDHMADHHDFVGLAVAGEHSTGGIFEEIETALRSIRAVDRIYFRLAQARRGRRRFQKGRGSGSTLYFDPVAELSAYL